MCYEYINIVWELSLVPTAKKEVDEWNAMFIPFVR